MVKKALIVDNDFFFLEFLADLLEKRGYEVIKAHDGKEGIAELNHESIDLLFLEIIMPKIDGRQLIRYARNNFPENNFPIIAVSSYLVEQIDEIDEIGADYYIPKGAMEKMGDHMDAFMEGLEEGSLNDFPDLNAFLEPGQVYPRQATAHLLDILCYHKAITESAGIGILVADKDAKVLHANATALAALKTKLEDILNCPVTSVFPMEEKDRLVTALKGVIRDDGPKRMCFSFQTNSEEIRTTVSVLNIKRKRLGWIISMDDLADG